MKNGWIGVKSQVLHTLQIFGADVDEHGKFKWYGKPPVSFMGMDDENAELVITDDAEVEIDGRRVPVIGLLGQTSYGSCITVV